MCERVSEGVCGGRDKSEVPCGESVAGEWSQEWSG